MKFLTFVLAAVLVAISPFEGAASSRIDNVVMEVDPSGRTTTEVTNIGEAPMGYVLTPYEWVIEDGEDVYTETKQFMAVPPTFQLAPGQTITVRVGLRNPTPARFERTYRLSVREVPTQTAEEGLAFAYNHMLPVYVAPAGGPEPINIEWSLLQRDGGWFVRAENMGNTRAVVRRLVVGGREVRTNSRATILARSWREYAVPGSAVTGESAQLEFDFTNGGSRTITINAR